MRAMAVRVSLRRGPAAVSILTVLAVAGLVLAGGGEAVARGAAGAGAVACDDTWTGQGAQPVWAIPQNWSTGAVPGRASNVCIDTAGDVDVDASIAVRSLHVNAGHIHLNGSAAHRLSAAITAAVDLSPGTGGGTSAIYLTDTTLTAARISDTG